MIGQTISHYQIVEKIGEGGMGQVFKALDARLNRHVAIKVLPADKVQDPLRRERFLREARAASALNHPNIITIYDILSENGNEFLVMEFINGQTIGDMLARGPIPIDRSIFIGAQIADALAVAHEAGIVHRDLKPGNVMLTGAGHVKLLDFGLAKLVQSNPSHDASATQDASLTMHNAIIGTPRYMSPEQAEGKKLDTRSDIFTFGVVLYEMVTGQFAFQAPTTLSTLTSVLRDEPKPLAEIVREAPEALAMLIARCIRKDPNERYQQMRVVYETLKEIGARPVLAATAVAGSKGQDETVEWNPTAKAVTVPQVQPASAIVAPSPAAGNKSKLMLVVGGAVVVVVAAGLGIQMSRQKQPEPPHDPPPQTAVPATSAEAPAPIPAGTQNAPVPPPITPRDAARVSSTPIATPPTPTPNAVPASVPPAPVAKVPAAPAHVTVTLKDATPVQLSLAAEIPEEADKGDQISFVAAKDVLVDGAVVIAKGAAAKGTIAEGSRRKMLIRKSATMLFETIQSIDGKQVRLRETSVPRAGANRKPRDVGKAGKDKQTAVPDYVAYIDGDVSLNAQPAAAK